MRDAMIAGATLNIFNNHAERVRMANLAQAINVLQAVILTDDEKLILTPTYHVMEMYKVHQDAKLIPIDVETGDYTFGKEKLPAISASASVDSTNNIHVSVVNIDFKTAHDVTIKLPDAYKNITARILSSSKIQDHNTFEKPDLITPKNFKGFQVKGSDLTIKMPPFSVVVFEIK